MPMIIRSQTLPVPAGPPAGRAPESIMPRLFGEECICAPSSKNAEHRLLHRMKHLHLAKNSLILIRLITPV